MVTRVHFEEETDAADAADVLYDAGQEVAVIKERFAGEDDDEEIVFVLATPCDEAKVRELLDLDEDAWVESD